MSCRIRFRDVVARYGAFVLLKPPVKPDTLLLWLLPPLALVGGGLALWLQVRRRAAAVGTGADRGVALSAEEERRLARLVSEDADPQLPV